MVNGQTTQEVTQLNIESLWAGGPFQYPVRIDFRALYRHGFIVHHAGIDGPLS